MIDRVQIQLFIGPAVPIPAPREVVEVLDQVQVESGSGATPSGFELTFKLTTRSPLHTVFLLTGGGASIPFLRVVVAATIRGQTTVLSDGVMTHHEVSSDGAGEQRLKIKGKDLSAVMDFIPLDGLPYPAMPFELRVLAALAKYAPFGVVPMVIPSVIPDISIPIERIPQHQGTDYAYIKALAEEAGYVFYLDPGPIPGVNKAYWGPEIRVGAAQPALNLDLDGPHNNVESLTFSFDKEQKELPVIFVQEPTSKAPIPIPIPDITPLNPPLGTLPPIPPKITLLRGTAKLNPAAASMKGLAYAASHADSVFGDGTLDVVRYGHVLKSRGLVGVRGAGPAFNGLHYVSSVTSTLTRGSFKQSFALARNGLLSTVPSVPA